MFEFFLGQATTRAAALTHANYCEREHNLSSGTEMALARYCGSEHVPLTEADLLGVEVSKGETSFEEACAALALSRFGEDHKATARAEEEAAIAKEIAEATTRAAMREDMASTGRVAPEPRQDMSPRVAAMLGIDPKRPITTEESANLQMGLRADGLPIAGKKTAAPCASLAEVFGLDPAGNKPIGKEFDNILAGLRADGAAVDASLFSHRNTTVEGAKKRLLAAYGVPSYREPEPEEIERMRRGMSANDDTVMSDKTYYRDINKTHSAVHYLGARVAAGKSVSVAWALAPTDAEKTIILNIHKSAVHHALLYVEERFAYKRLGRNGSAGREAGELGWFRYTHYTARPTAEIVQMGDDKQPFTATQEIPIKQPDPHLHDHVFIPNAILTKSGQVASLDGDDVLAATKEMGAKAFVAALVHGYIPGCGSGYFYAQSVIDRSALEDLDGWRGWWPARRIDDRPIRRP